MTELYVRNTAKSVFVIGLFVLSVLSLVGLVYLSRMAYSEKTQDDGKYCGDTDTTQRNLARLSIVLLWILISWIFIGSILQTIWKGYF